MQHSRFTLACFPYVFADARHIPDLENSASELLFQKMDQSFWTYPEEIVEIYDNTLESSPLRRVLVDWSVIRLDWGRLDPAELGESFPKQFLADVIHRSAKSGHLLSQGSARRQKEELKSEFCKRYHNHPEENQRLSRR